MYEFSEVNEGNLNDVVSLHLDVYPGIAQTSTFEQYSERLKVNNERTDVTGYCIHKDGVLVGCYHKWDFEMNLRQTKIKAGGIGSVGVDLAYKKEKICKEMLHDFLKKLRAEDAYMAMLYPFNSAFYHRMGFGFGTLLQQFRIKPNDLPGGASKKHIKRMGEQDATRLAEFYNSQMDKTHGLIKKSTDEFTKQLKNRSMKFFAYVNDNGNICGYISFIFKKGSDESSLVNDIFMGDMLFDSPEVFLEIMSFLKSQSDQARYIIISTQDEGFISSVADPRNHMERILTTIYQEVCRTGLGIMYRICDTAAFFKSIKDVSFGGLNMTLQVNINDSFLPENNKAVVLEFVDGKCKTVSDPAEGAEINAELNIDIAEFSSLVMGCVNLKSLVKYGKASLSDNSCLETLSRAFTLDEKPVCLTYF